MIGSFSLNTSTWWGLSYQHYYIMPMCHQPYNIDNHCHQIPRQDPTDPPTSPTIVLLVLWLIVVRKNIYFRGLRIIPYWMPLRRCGMITTHQTLPTWLSWKNAQQQTGSWKCRACTNNVMVSNIWPVRNQPRTTSNSLRYRGGRCVRWVNRVVSVPAVPHQRGSERNTENARAEFKWGHGSV